MRPETPHVRPDQFATTRWSIVVSAGQNSCPNSRQALATLCEVYWVPLYGYVRRRVDSVAEANDVTQAFFAELLEKNFVKAADPQRGKFRAFLLTSLKNFLSKRWASQRALKRGGGQSVISLDFATADSEFRMEPSSGLTAEQLYDRDWAMALLQRIMQRLKDEFESNGKATQYEQLKPFLVGEHEGLTWADAAASLKISEAAAKMAGSRMRRRYRELLRMEISETVCSPEEVDDEIRNLFATLGL